MNKYARLVRFVIPHAWELVLAAVCMVITSAFGGVSISMIIPLVDKVIAGKKIMVPGNVPLPAPIQYLLDAANSMSAMELLNSMMIIVTVLWLLKNFFGFYQTYLMNDVSQRVIRDVKNTIYKKFLTLSMDFYSRNSTGKLMSRVTYDAAIIRDSISSGLTDLFYQPIQLIIYMSMLIGIKVYFSISWVLIVISIGIFLLVVYPVMLIGKKLKAISKKSQEKMGDITTTLHETISGVRVVKAFSMEDYEAKKFADQNNYFYKLEMKSVKRMAVVSPLTEFVGMICVAVILWIAGKEIVSGALSAGAFVTFLACMLSILKPIKRLTNVYNINQQALAAADRIFETLDANPSVMEKPGAVELPRIRERVALRHVYFRYEDKDILKDINIEVKVGEIAAFVGPSGVGKTTLVNLVPRFYDVTEGQILVDGIDVRDCTLKSLMGQIGIVTQETILFNDTVASNIAYGTRSFDKDGVMRAAKIANAHDFIMRMPKGYETMIGERGFRLSGGEKQRLAIARAVFKDPPILILDEATSQLDTESEILVQEAIDRMMKGRTVFVIAHRLSTIKHATSIYVLDGGRVVDKGSHEELIAKEGLYKRLYDMQFRDNVLK
ncbi:MAG: ABC transporter transmembrane domain-containing protein [Candidatus Omnitrophica bacterium]|nr:ABC transporter transmembrane domain-containing protein [Candidatus Omnitrophota bacterium]